MARVFLDGRVIEIAVPARNAVETDGHECEIVESARDIQGRVGNVEEVALVLTGSPTDRVGGAMRGVFEAEIPRPPVIAFHESSDPEVRRRLGADADLDDVLSLPVDPDEVRVVLDKLLDRYQLQRETGIVGRSEPIHEILEKIHLIAPVHSTVLVTGESGTGKELVARAIHRRSSRRGKPFIAVNCAALPESLLESELFGHEKGAFTGATSLRRGMFELADGGTLFLDEIAEMPLQTQTRLLRVLESRRFMRVGGDRELEVNVRVVAATNRHLRTAVEHGEFRRDLYYRLNVLHIDLPPLRERREDIPILVRRFIAEFSRVHDREFRGLTPESMDILLRYSWPGNVRELRNLIESMVVLAPGSVIRPEDIPEEIRTGSGARLLPASLPTLPAPEVRSPGDVAGSATVGTLPDAGGGRQLEFVFRTLVALKVDVEDLKREFEAYKRARSLPSGPGRWGGGAEIEIPEVVSVDEVSVSTGAGASSTAPENAATSSASIDADRRGRDDEIEFRPGMPMAELERRAIIATLRAVGGNRRKAAEQLQIGERTLYRKIKEYEIDL